MCRHIEFSSGKLAHPLGGPLLGIGAFNIGQLIFVSCVFNQVCSSETESELKSLDELDEVPATSI